MALLYTGVAKPVAVPPEIIKLAVPLVNKAIKANPSVENAVNQIVSNPIANKIIPTSTASDSATRLTHIVVNMLM